MGRTHALTHRAAKLRLKLRGSIGVPNLVVNTKSSPPGITERFGIGELIGSVLLEGSHA
jgi:hypothetical protein